jgi:hypothetical protein
MKTMGFAAFLCASIAFWKDCRTSSDALGCLRLFFIGDFEALQPLSHSASADTQTFGTLTVKGIGGNLQHLVSEPPYPASWQAYYALTSVQALRP